MNIQDSKSLEIRKMIEEAVEVILVNEKTETPQRAFNRLLNHCAFRVGATDSDGPYSIATHTYLNTQFTPEDLAYGCLDHLGFVYEKIRRGFENLKSYKDDDEVTAEARRIYSGAVADKARKKTLYPCAVLDKGAATGRLILALWREVIKHKSTETPEILIYATESSLTEYRICLYYIHLHKIPATVLKCQASRKTTGTDSPNWEFADRWTPTGQPFLEDIVKTVKPRKRLSQKQQETKP